jgi:serine/threonine protein kinase
VHAVRKVVEPHKGEWFALKTLTKASILSTKGGIDAVMTELHALVNLSHPFICNIHYAFQDRCCLFLIIDLALGGDLRYHLRHAPGNRFSEERCKFYIAQLLLALDFVHSRNFLHR